MQVLPDILASQVAAGEVVERPASVVKELVENAIDAGARKVEVVVRKGGSALIRVVDDGSGMGRADAEMALERHATSKLRSSDDLESIYTLGFRGEALPSIASVGRFSLVTRERGADAGTAVVVDGGVVVSVGDSGEPPGTQIEVRDLFYNVPARRKFLRTESTEFGHVEHQVRLHAAAYPEVAFTLVHNDRVCFQLAPAKDRLERVRGLAGAALASGLIPIELNGGDGYSVAGLISGPGLTRSGKVGQLVFMNRRPIDNAQVTYGLREGYRGALPKGQYPVTYLFLTVPPAEVDVNVHPAKREVRFRHGNKVRDMVAEAVTAALQAHTTSQLRPHEERVVEVVPELPKVERPVQAPVEKPRVPAADPFVEPQREFAKEVIPVEPMPDLPATIPEPVKPVFETIGVLGKGTILLRSDEGLVLLDQRAAHERVLFERVQSDLKNGTTDAQPLLVPVTLELPPKDFALVRQNRETLSKAGIGIEEFGANAVKIDCLPAFLSDRDPMAIADAIVRELKLASDGVTSQRLRTDLVAGAVCRIAVRQRDSLSESEIEQLVEDLLECEMPYCNPKGRPTLVQISYQEIDRKFGRR